MRRPLSLLLNPRGRRGNPWVTAKTEYQVCMIHPTEKRTTRTEIPPKAKSRSPEEHLSITWDNECRYDTHTESNQTPAGPPSHPLFLLLHGKGIEIKRMRGYATDHTTTTTATTPPSPPSPSRHYCCCCLVSFAWEGGEDYSIS